MPGRKWSTPLVVASIGTRAGAVQVMPSVLFEKTMSLAGQPERNRQSCHAAYTVPAPSTSADGMLGLRSPPATEWSETPLTVTAEPHDAPPLVERNAPTPDSFCEYGTTT